MFPSIRGEGRAFLVWTECKHNVSRSQKKDDLSPVRTRDGIPKAGAQQAAAELSIEWVSGLTAVKKHACLPPCAASPPSDMDLQSNDEPT